MFLKYEKLLSILEKCMDESALTFHFGKVCDADLCYLKYNSSSLYIIKMCEGKID